MTMMAQKTIVTGVLKDSILNTTEPHMLRLHDILLRRILRNKEKGGLLIVRLFLYSDANNHFSAHITDLNQYVSIFPDPDL
jgi:hypothetical protein